MYISGPVYTLICMLVMLNCVCIESASSIAVDTLAVTTGTKTEHSAKGKNEDNLASSGNDDRVKKSSIVVSVDVRPTIGSISSATEISDGKSSTVVVDTVPMIVVQQDDNLDTTGSNTISTSASSRKPSERLKKGLSSLLTQWNNTPFYGAPTGANAQVEVLLGTSTTAVQEDYGGGDQNAPLANDLVKARVGRMAHTRPLGRPLRWG